jgi:hypothetical protein
MHLCYPACVVEYTSRLPEISVQLRALLARQSGRQGWSMLSFSAFSEIPLTLQAAAMMGLKETAILPFSYPASNLNRSGSSGRNGKGQRSSRRDRQPRSHTVSSQLIFRPDLEPARDLYVPEQHREMCSRLYSDLGLARRIIDTSPGLGGGLPADSRAMERNYFPASRTSFLFLQPGLVSYSERQIFNPASCKAQTVYAIANLSDPACPAFCAKLEESGYRFSGILPLYKGRDSIVYFWSSAGQFEGEQFESTRAGMLSNYIADGASRPPAEFMRTGERKIDIYAGTRNH